METFYDGDLKDIWDSDLDPSDSLKLSTDSDMHDWFLERDVRDAPVILNDKLISDALLNGTLPIKSEHSYSLNSDGDSLPDSPASLHTRMDDMEDECYPAISLKTATSNIRAPSATSTVHSAHIVDPKCMNVSPSLTSIANISSNTTVTSLNLQSLMQAAATATNNNNSCDSYLSSLTSSSKYAGLCKLATGPIKLSLRPLDSVSQTITDMKLLTDKQRLLQSQQHQQHQYLPQDNVTTSIIDNDGESSICSREDSQSPDICSDIEIDESCVKNEPLSPSSSYPPSPEAAEYSLRNGTNNTLSLTMANMAAFANSELVFEHKNGCLQLTPSSQNLLKSQQILLNSNSQNVIIPKINIKTENIMTAAVTTTSSSLTNGNNNNSYGLPLTPPSSLSSEGSEGNLTPEHQLSPHSPATSATNARTATTSSTHSTSGILTVTSMRRGIPSNSTSTSNYTTHIGRLNNGGSTRQPIHTPLISSQPKGSTGTLMLTEEEKRTLLAEGYPIPQKLPLTKAEEKSLKKIRRKIKNKISAQESRRKKKEYMDQLERKVEVLVSENNEYKKRVQTLEDSNASLLSQLHKLQAHVYKNNNNLKKP